MARDNEVIGCLDEDWQTVIQIRSRLGLRGAVSDLTTTLRRLAEAGHIERQTQPTTAPGRRGNRQIGKRAIEFFRRRRAAAG